MFRTPAGRTATGVRVQFNIRKPAPGLPCPSACTHPLSISHQCPRKLRQERQKGTLPWVRLQSGSI
eukprot:9238201-Alexandrium_andersonii.AAC.1